MHSLTLKSVLKEIKLSIYDSYGHTDPYRCLLDNQQMTQSGAGVSQALAQPHGCSVHGTGVRVLSKKDRVHLKWPPIQTFPPKVLNSPQWRTANAKVSEQKPSAMKVSAIWSHRCFRITRFFGMLS